MGTGRCEGPLPQKKILGCPHFYVVIKMHPFNRGAALSSVGLYAFTKVESDCKTEMLKCKYTLKCTKAWTLAALLVSPSS